MRPGRPRCGKFFSARAAVVDRFHRFTRRAWIIFRDALKYALQVVRSECRPPDLHQELPSGTDQPIKPLSDLFVREIFTALQTCFAQPDGFNKAGSSARYRLIASCASASASRPRWAASSES